MSSNLKRSVIVVAFLMFAVMTLVVLMNDHDVKHSGDGNEVIKHLREFARP